MAIGVVVLTKSPSNGTDAVLYNIVPSTSAITYDVNSKTSSPSSVTVKLKKTVGSVVTYPSVLPDGYKMWYKLDTDSGYGQVSNNGYVYKDGWGIGGQIEVYLTNNNSAPDSTKSNVISGISVPFVQTGANGTNGDNAFNIYLAPSNIAIGDKADGTLDLSTTNASIVGKYGSNAATIALNGSLIATNCKASFDSTTKVLSITEVLKQDVAYTYNGTQYTALAYCPSGYVLIPVTATYGSKNISVTLRLDFTVSGFIATQENSLKVTKVITDNNTIKVDVATISQKADDICLSISESYMDTLEKNGNGNISIFDITGGSLCQYTDGNFTQMQGNTTNHVVILGKSISGLTVGIEYTVHFLIKQNAGDGPISLFAGVTAGGTNIMVCDLANADGIGTYKDYGGFKDIVGTFKSTSTTMIVGFKIILNDVDSYLDIDINGFTIGYDIASKLLVTGIDIKNRRIVATADSFVIQDNSGNINSVFETVNGKPVMKAQYIQADKIVATKIQTSESGVRTEIINNIISQYNDYGELTLRIHGGPLNSTTSTTGATNISSIRPGVLNMTVNASSGLRQEFDVALSEPFEILSLMNTIKVLDSSGNTSVPIECAITCNNVAAIGFELYISDRAEYNMGEAQIWQGNPSTGPFGLTKGMSGTAVLSSPISSAGCKIYVHFTIVFKDSTGSLVIRNTNLEEGIESILNVSVKYGENVTEIAKDGFLTSFGNFGFKITASGIQKSTDGCETWSPI